MGALNAGFSKAFRHRDFRLLWFGAFFSFVGSWIQNVAQGWLVYHLTHDEAKLALVSFCSMAPVSVFGPFAGTLADMFNKRSVLILTQAIFAVGAIFLAVVTYYGVVQYWHIIAVALTFGVVGCIEMPTRQSVVGKCVPPEDLSAAIPLNSMTINLARVIGPAIGGILLAKLGAQSCYFLNGLSFLALIAAAAAIKADLRAVAREPQPIGDLLMEGMRYTLRDRRLRMLFVMESLVSTFGLFYLSLMPAFVVEVLGMTGKQESQTGLSIAMTAVGVGAMLGLLMMTYLSERPLKGPAVRVSMFTMGLSLVLLGFTTIHWIAFLLLGLLGGSAIVQFNTTNTLFQLLSPERLRGRVLSMHIWALSGLSPIGILFFGWLSRQTRTASTWQLGSAVIHLPPGGIPLTVKMGGACILVGTLWAYIKRANMAGIE